MYRHFAIVTVAVTLLVALFANGENRQAMAQAVDDRKAATEAAEFKDFKFGKPHFVATKLQARVYNRSSDYEDSVAGYGAPMDQTGSQVSSSASFGGATDRGSARYLPASYAAHQISEAELAKLTPEQREALLEQVANGGRATDQGERQRQINALVSASQRRAGSDSGAE